MGGRTGELFVEGGATDHGMLVTWGAALRCNLLLSPWSPLKLSRRAEAGEHGPVYSAVTAHVTGHCMCHLS